MYEYPYGDSQQLNLDWILAKLKELEAAGASGGADLETVSNALLSLTYNTSTAYRRYDYAFLNGKLYRCLTDTSGVFNPTAWQEALIGDDLAVLTRWINAIDAAAVVDVKFDTSGTNGKLQQKYHDQYHDVVEVDYTPVQNSKRPLSSNAGYDLNNAINDISDFTNTKLKKWDVKTNGKIIFFGNSYAKDTNTQWAKWPDIAASTMGLGAEGGNWWNMGQAGSAMTTGEFLAQLQTWKTNNPNEVNNIGAVICVAGLNDSTASACNNIPSAMQTLVNWVNSNLPKAKVYFGYTGFVNQAVNMWSHPSTDEYRFLAMINYTKCTEYGAIYLSGVENIIHDKNLLDSDGIHPNATGAKLLGQGVVNALLQGFASSCSTSGALVPTASSGLIYGSVYQFSTNGIVTTTFNIGVRYNDVSPYPTFNVGSEVEIGTLILPFTNGLESMDVALSMYANGTGNVLNVSRLAVDKTTNKLKLRVGAFGTGASGYDIVEIPAFSFSVTRPLYQDLYTTV